MSSSVDYIWDNCPQWLFQWFIGGSFYVVVSVWSLTEFLRIIIKLSKFKTQLLNQNNDNNNNNNNNNKSKQNKDSDDFNMSYNFTFSLNKQMNDNSNDNNDMESKNSSNTSTNYSIYSNKQYAKTDTKKENKVNTKVHIFGSRSSQKAFLIVIFFQSLFRSIECLSIAFIKKITSSKHKNCSMAVVDSIAGANSVWYMYCESLGALLFPMAFSCLAYQLAKIYYRFNYDSVSVKHVQQSIYSFLYGLISLNIMCCFGIFGLLFWIQFGEHTASHSTLETYYSILYGIMCIILAICYARFAFPIYRIYTKIMVIINHKKTTKKERKRNLSFKSLEAGDFIDSPLISEDHRDLIYENAELNENSGHKVNNYKESTDSSLLYSDYCDIYQLETRRKRYCCKCCYYDESDNIECTFTDYSKITKVKMPTDAQMFYAQFIASMKRTWITALYCGIAFLVRAIILLIPPITSWYENKVYIHALYFLLLEILPIFAMLYIYSNATKSIGKN